MNKFLAFCIIFVSNLFFGIISLLGLNYAISIAFDGENIGAWVITIIIFLLFIALELFCICFSKKHGISSIIDWIGYVLAVFIGIAIPYQIYFLIH